jgi:hypothetical protein
VTAGAASRAEDSWASHSPAAQQTAEVHNIAAFFRDHPPSGLREFSPGPSGPMIGPRYLLSVSLPTIPSWWGLHYRVDRVRTRSASHLAAFSFANRDALRGLSGILTCGAPSKWIPT